MADDSEDDSDEDIMKQRSNTAHSRLGERAFTIWEEAGGNDSEGFRLWHKLRPLLSPQDFPSLIHRRDDGGPADKAGRLKPE